MRKTQTLFVPLKLLIRLEATIGIEPMNKGFADHIFSHHSQKDTEYQVGTKTTTSLFTCSSLAVQKIDSTS